MELVLNDAEARVLREVLAGDLSRLLLEIANTDVRSMREGLRERETILRGILDRLPREVGATA